MEHNQWDIIKQQITNSIDKAGIDPTIWKYHPIYTDFCCNLLGYVLNTKTKKMIGTLQTNGYIRLGLRHNGSQIMVYAHRFVLECHHGMIPSTIKDESGQDKVPVVDHIDGCHSNNAIINLRLVTQSQNNATGNTGNHAKKSRPVWSVNQETGQTDWFESMTSASKYLNIHPNSIRSVCEKKTKSATSKSNGQSYYFCYGDDLDDPLNQIS